MNEQKISRRKFLTLAASAAGGAMLAASGQQVALAASDLASGFAAPLARTSPREQETYTLTFTSVVSSEWPYYAARVKVWEKWQESHPGVTVEYEYLPYDQFAVQLVTRALAGEAPPIAQAGYQTAQFVTGDVLVQTDPYIERDKVDRDNWWPALVEIITFDNKTWGAPFTMDTRFTYVNPELYEKAGVKYPETWDDMLAVAKPFRDIGAHAFGMVMTTEILGIWQTGASMIKQAGSDFIKVNPDNTASANMDTPECLDLCNFLLELQEVEAVPPSFITDGQAEAQSMFMQGLTASYPIGNWMIESFKKFRDEGTMAFQEDNIHHPIRKQKGAAAGGWSWYIFKTIKDPDLGWDFVSFFLQDENVNEGWADSLPPTKSGMKVPYFSKEPRNEFVAEVLEYSSWPVPPVAGWFEILPVIWRNIMKANSKEMPPEDALKLGQQEVQQLLDEGHNKLVAG